ncbi:MAG: hypothetical protein BGP25_02930 [Lysobacterales bacterium 63-13]|nr:MAG: hypothetical protein BGP25_02930 [Xanthomonadales bacterium 63-13]
MSLAIALDDIGAGAPQQAAIGSVIGVVSDRALVFGWVVGQGGLASHAVMTDEQGTPRAWLLDRLGITHAMHVARRASLVLTLSSNEANPHAIRNHVGCLGLTQHGPVVCAGEQRDAWGHLVPLYIDLRSGEVRDEMAQAAAHAVWLTTWSLSLKGADDQLTRIICNPDWPQATRDQR